MPSIFQEPRICCFLLVVWVGDLWAINPQLFSLLFLAWDLMKFPHRRTVENLLFETQPWKSQVGQLTYVKMDVFEGVSK